MELVNNTTTGIERCAGFVMRKGNCGTEEWEQPTYSDADRARGARVRDLRQALGWSLRNLAQALGIRLVEASRLEMGKAWFASAEDEAAALAILNPGA